MPSNWFSTRSWLRSRWQFAWVEPQRTTFERPDKLKRKSVLHLTYLMPRKPALSSCYVRRTFDESLKTRDLPPLRMVGGLMLKQRPLLLRERWIPDIMQHTEPPAIS